MDVLAHIADTDIGAEAHGGPQRERWAARALFFDGDELALLHVSKHGYYKLPGGGVEKKEDIATALRRELLEETGCEAEVEREIGTIIEHRTHQGLLQYSRCFIAQATGERRKTAFTRSERKEGFELLWVRPEEALRLLSIEPDDYQGKFTRRRDRLFLEKALKGRSAQAKE